MNSFVKYWTSNTGSATKMVCYFTNWSQYRPGEGKYMPQDVDPFLCTTLIYAFSIINSNNELVTYEWNDETLYKTFNGLKAKWVGRATHSTCWAFNFVNKSSLFSRNPQLKTLLAVGGWNFGSTQWGALAYINGINVCAGGFLCWFKFGKNRGETKVQLQKFMLKDELRPLVK